MERVQDNRKRSFLVVILILAFILIGLIVFAAIVFLRSPLAQRLVLNITPAATVVAAQMETAPTATLPPPLPAATVTPAPTAVPAGTCGQTGTLMLLFNGTGVAQGMTSADAIRVIKVNFDQPEMVIVAFPRDLWVKTTRLSSLNMAEARLGPSFHFMQQTTNGTAQEKSLAGTTVVAQALYDNFAVQPQHYMTVNLEAWGKVIDTIGGVEVSLPGEMKSETGIVIPAGKQVLNGQLSKEYIRSLASGGEAARLQRQNLYAQALRKKVMNSQIIPQVPQLLTQFNDVLVTDLTPAQLVSLACMVENTPADQVSFYEISGDMVTTRTDGALAPNMDKINNNLNLWLGE